MVLKCEICVKLVLYNKYTGNPIVLEQNICQSYDEHSETFKDMCERYRDIIGFDRSDNVDEFDKEFLKIVSEESKKSQQDILNNMRTTWKEVYLQECKGACCSFAGATYNPADFCMIKIEDFKINVSKKEN